MAYGFHDDKGKAAVYTKTESDNTFLTKTDAGNLYQTKLTFDLSPTDGSSNPVTSDGIYDALHALDDKFLAIYGQYAPEDVAEYWDDEPTDDSKKPVTSEGIKNYVDQAVSDAVGRYAADFIVEEGTYTTGQPGDDMAYVNPVTWSYRKWNSGIAECWAKEWTFFEVYIQWGNIFRNVHTSCHQAYPKDKNGNFLFIEQPDNLSISWNSQYLGYRDGAVYQDRQDGGFVVLEGSGSHGADPFGHPVDGRTRTQNFFLANAAEVCSQYSYGGETRRFRMFGYIGYRAIGRWK